jgi:hypothetical protein
MNSLGQNPWTHEDEGDHHPVMKEWWTIENTFETDDKRKWNLMSSFEHEMETPSSFFQYVLFDITSKKCVLHSDINTSFEKLIYAKNKVDLKFENSTLKGLYPEYKIHIEDKKQEFNADIEFKAQSLPHWIAQDTTGGNLPIGLNYYRYGFLPNCNSTGTLTINKKQYKTKGKGYLEHAWGNWSYQNPFQKISDLKKTLSVYGRLGKWWLSHHKIHIPKSISFSTDNNAFGYDWIWGVFDNDWSMFFGNSMFWVSNGPSFGALYVTADGKKYWEFCNLKFQYNKLNYIKKYDIYYPTDMEITGILEDKKINLRFWTTVEPYVYTSPYDKDRFYKAFVLIEEPGKMKGTFSDSKKTIELKGDCKLVPLRQPSFLGHNSISFDFLKPPKGFGVDIDFCSHFINRKISSKIYFAPRPHFKFNIEKIPKNK